MITPSSAGLLAAADQAFRALDRSLTGDERSRLEQVPLARGIDAMDAYPVGAPLLFMNRALFTLTDDVRRLGGDAWLDRYFRLLLLALLIRTLTRPVPYELPPSVDTLLAANRRRIVDNASAPCVVYTLDGAFVRDRGFCVGTVLPFGLGTGHLDSSLPKDTLARAGLAHLQETPWVDTHLDMRPGGGGYTLEAQLVGSHRLADFLRCNPSYQGMFGVGWLNDPALGDISPHLARHTEALARMGVVFLRLATAGEDTARLATGTSKTRRRLYEEGRYKPAEYMTIWPADNVLRWSDAALRRRDSGAS